MKMSKMTEALDRLDPDQRSLAFMFLYALTEAEPKTAMKAIQAAVDAWAIAKNNRATGEAP